MRKRRVRRRGSPRCWGGRGASIMHDGTHTQHTHKGGQGQQRPLSKGSHESHDRPTDQSASTLQIAFSQQMYGGKSEHLHWQLVFREEEGFPAPLFKNEDKMSWKRKNPTWSPNFQIFVWKKQPARQEAGKSILATIFQCKRKMKVRICNFST